MNKSYIHTLYLISHIKDIEICTFCCENLFKANKNVKTAALEDALQ